MTPCTKFLWSVKLEIQVAIKKGGEGKTIRRGNQDLKEYFLYYYYLNKLEYKKIYKVVKPFSMFQTRTLLSTDPDTSI